MLGREWAAIRTEVVRPALQAPAPPAPPAAPRRPVADWRRLALAAAGIDPAGWTRPSGESAGIRAPVSS
ncbi:hypothetical protein [Amycolatopsis kentuckyensis]|uniref:hypothetical protein n=1 Tax=Amycolatopsis kentuckyensis TaxID=218823 RepID=UPI00356723E9